MNFFVLLLAIFAPIQDSPEQAEKHKAPALLVNTKQVSDYRTFAELKRTLTETPDPALVEPWRQTYREVPTAQLEAALRATPGLQTWKLRGIDDGVDTPSLRLEFKTLLDLDGPILAFSYQTQFRQRVEALINYLESLPVEDDAVQLPALQSQWSEEILLPPNFVLASPLAEKTTPCGLVQLAFTVQRQSGRLTLQLRASLAQATVTPEQRAETLTALRQFPESASLQFEARVLAELATDTVAEAMFELKAQGEDDKAGTWATIQRAAAFAELFLPKLGVAVLDEALAEKPDDASLLRARIMIGLQLEARDRARPPLVACLERLLKLKPGDAPRLRLMLAKQLIQTSYGEASPSQDELKRAAAVFRELPPEHWTGEYAELLVTLGDFATLKRLQSDAKAKLDKDERRVAGIIAKAGLGDTAGLETLLAKLEHDQAVAAVDKAYVTLLEAAQVEALRVLSRHSHDLLDPKRLSEIEAAVSEARILPSNRSPEGIYRQLLRAVSQRDLGAIDRLVLPLSLEIDRDFFKKHMESAISSGGLKWPFGLEELKSEGDPDLGYRVEAGGSEYFFAGNQDGYRLVCTDRSLSLAGHYVMQMLERGQLERAYHWLDWCFRPQDGTRMRWLVNTEGFWGGSAPRDEETALLAANIMITLGKGREQARQALQAAFEEAVGTRKDNLALLFILTSQELDDFLRQADFTPAAPDSPNATILGFWMCMIQGQCAYMEEECAKVEEQDGEVCSLITAGIKGGYEAVLAKLQSLAETSEVTDSQSEVLLHFALLEPEVPTVPETLVLTQNPDELMRYYAEQNRMLEVLEIISTQEGRIANRGLEAYLLGRLAEFFAEPKLARTFYAETEQPGLLMSQIESNYRLSKKHLNRLAKR